MLRRLGGRECTLLAVRAHTFTHTLALLHARRCRPRVGAFLQQAAPACPSRRRAQQEYYQGDEEDADPNAPTGLYVPSEDGGAPPAGS